MLTWALWSYPRRPPCLGVGQDAFCFVGGGVFVIFFFVIFFRPSLPILILLIFLGFLPPAPVDAALPQGGRA